MQRALNNHFYIANGIAKARGLQFPSPFVMKAIVDGGKLYVPRSLDRGTWNF